MSYIYTMPYRFPKNEKLKSRKTIQNLFSTGKRLNHHPLRMIYIRMEGSENNKAGFSVPKKTFGKAVDRNRTKRQMREAYRLHKNTLKPNNSDHFAFLFLYIGKEGCDFSTIEKSMISLLRKLPE